MGKINIVGIVNFIIISGTSAWQRVRCEGVPPSPCDYHSIVVFQQQGSPPADRSHSAPHVGRNCSALLGPRTPQLRPNSSPAAMAAIHGTVPFQNKVEPCCKNSTWSSSPERCEIEMCVAQRARTENPPLDATRVSCPLCSATGTLATYQLRKSWSIDFCTRTGLRFRKVTDTRPLIQNGKYTNSSSENISLSSFGGSMNPIYDNSPPYTSINQFQCRITDHENIPLKKLRQDNASSLSARYDFHDNGASQFLASTRLCLGENRSHMGQSKLKNHFKSSSLESLLSRFDSAEIGGADNQVTCRSVMKDDLIIEDIEETSFSCSDDVTNEIVMSSDKQSQEQGHFNCGATITNHVVACKVSDSSKSLIFVNNSATSDLHPVNVDTTGQLVRSDTNELRESDNETMCHSKMAWLLPSGEGSKENVAANTNYFEEKCEDEVIPDNEGVLVKMIAPSVTLSASGDTWHMSAVSDDRNPAVSNTGPTSCLMNKVCIEWLDVWMDRILFGYTYS